MKPPSHQPQAAGYIGLAAVLAAIIHAVLIRRVPAVEELTLWVATIAAAWGNLMSRQWNVASEQVGCQPNKLTSPPLPPPRASRPPSGNAGAPTRIISAAVLLVGLAGSGCILSHRDKGDIVSLTQSCIGIDISQSPADAVPHFRVGYIRSQIHVVPTGKGTNGVIHAPPVGNSAHTEVTLGRTDIIEDFTTGSAAEDDVWRDGQTAARTAAATRTNNTNSTSKPK